MIRIALMELAFFLLPFVLFYFLVVRRKKGEQVTWPVLYLSIAGLTIAAIAMFWLAAVDGEDPDLHYTPAQDTTVKELDPTKPAYRQ